MTSQSKVTQKILEMIQTWGIAGRSKHEFKLATDLYSIMKAEGYSFPEAVADNELIVDAAVAPVWKEGDECFRCKVSFKTSGVFWKNEIFRTWRSFSSSDLIFESLFVPL